MTNNQLAENSVIQLLNSVKLARDNAERADNRVDHSFYYALTIALEELQERRKADSEPVAYTEKHEISNMHATGLYLRAWPTDRARNAVEGYTIPLYLHAQQAPVVQKLDEREAFEAFMEGRFGDTVDRRRAKNGDQGYMAWDMAMAWVVWEARAQK